MSDEPALTGTLVTLRRWRPSDVDDVFRICQDREIQKWTMVPAPYSRADAVFFTGELSESGWNSGESASFAVVAGRTSEALRLVTAWCLGERGCARVELTTDVDNVGSRRVAESAGFVLEGIVRQRLIVKGKRIDAALYSRLPTDPPAPATDQP